LFYFTAPFIARFYNVSLLTDITRVVALSLIINALGSVQQTRLTINLRFGTQAVLSIVSLCVSSCVGIIFAYMGYGPWALVLQSILGGAINTIILWCVTKWHPILAVSAQSFVRLFGFGSKLLCSGMINTIYSNLYTLVIGKAFGPVEIGHFNRANGFAMLPTDTLTGIVVKVNYPLLVRFQDDTPRLISAYRKLLRMPFFILVPVLFGMATLANPMISLLIGEKWLPCVPFLQVLCIGMIWDPLTHINLNLLYVKGRTDLVLKLELIKKPIAFIILFSMMPFGIFWMCVGKAFYCFIAFALNCYYTNKILGYGFRSQMREVFPIMLNAGIMAALVIFVSHQFVSSSAKLIAGVLIGIFSYMLLAIISRDQALFYIIESYRAWKARKA
jgi:O-antigen/teichoic acid export membrane protein